MREPRRIAARSLAHTLRERGRFSRPPEGGSFRYFTFTLLGEACFAGTIHSVSLAGDLPIYGETEMAASDAAADEALLPRRRLPWSRLRPCTPGMPRRLGVGVPCGRDDANHEPKATAPSRGGVGRKPECESMTRGTRTASEGGAVGASQHGVAKPVVIERPQRKCGGCVEKVAWLIPGGLHGRPGWDGGGREAVARRGEVSRGRGTGGDRDGRREGPNAEPRQRAFVLVGVAMIAANPVGGLGGRVGGCSPTMPVESGAARRRRTRACLTPPKRVCGSGFCPARTSRGRSDASSRTPVPRASTG